jgi:exosortase/archaeosortase family protein
VSIGLLAVNRCNRGLACVRHGATLILARSTEIMALRDCARHRHSMLFHACRRAFQAELDTAVRSGPAIISLAIGLFEDSAFMDANTRILGARDFRVRILADCSGYEGVTLIFGFLAIYLCVFRRSLRFPNVFLLLPIGTAAIWLLNAVRIALPVMSSGSMTNGSKGP